MMPLKPHPTEPDKMVYESNKYDLPKREWVGLKDKPVAWGMEKDGVILDVICPAEHEREEGKYTIPLYTHPKEWVGFTNEERQEIHGSSKSPYDDLLLVEAKLKEKNGY
jgi:hypothetical protein